MAKNSIEFSAEFFDYVNSVKTKKSRNKIHQEAITSTESENIKQEKEVNYGLRFDKYKLFKVNLPINRWLDIDGDIMWNDGRPYKKCLIAARLVDEILVRFNVSVLDVEPVDIIVVL